MSEKEKAEIKLLRKKLSIMVDAIQEGSGCPETHAATCFSFDSCTICWEHWLDKKVEEDV